MEDLTGCRNSVARGTHGTSDCALVVYVSCMSVARKITALVKELVRTYKQEGDRGVQAVLDAYAPVAERKSPPPDDGQEKTGKVLGDAPTIHTFHKRHRETQRKATAWIKENPRYMWGHGNKRDGCGAR